MERINSDFSGSVDTKLHSVGGRRVRTLQNFDLYVVPTKYKPDLVFLQIGENDISTDSSATTIANNIDLLQLARTIRRMKVPKVVIGSNIELKKRYETSHYTFLPQYETTRLRNALHPQKIHSFWFPVIFTLSNDMVMVLIVDPVEYC